MRSFQSLLVSALTIFVIMALTTDAASMVLFDSSLIANAQSPRQSITSRPVTQQQEEETIIRQGTVTSSQDPLLGHEEHQMATILPFRPDGTIYEGILTYTATEPVEVVILDIQILNETEQQILNATEDDSEFGTLLTSQLDNQTSLAISYITPEYGDTPAPSASIPFAGNAVWLHTLSGEPFAATFAASAQVLKSEIRNNVSSLADPTLAATPEVDETDAEDDAGTANATTTTFDDNTATTTTDANTLEADDDAANSEEVIVRIPQGSSSLTDDAYIPNPVEVSVGDTVTWINDDFTTHTATSGDPGSGSTGIFGGSEDSPEIIGPEGDTQSYTFDEAGEFPYYCTLHPSMVGTVVVTE
jgi:plastocyanin